MSVHRLLQLGLLVAGLVLAAVGIVYLAVQCRNIPWPLPGREAGSTDHRPGYAAAALVGALVVGGAGGSLSRLRLRPR